MTERSSGGTAARRRTIGDLHEVIAALDGRLPQLERSGEASIASVAAALKAEALRRIAELEEAEAAETRS